MGWTELGVGDDKEVGDLAVMRHSQRGPQAVWSDKGTGPPAFVSDSEPESGRTVFAKGPATLVWSLSTCFPSKEP